MQRQMANTVPIRLPSMMLFMQFLLRFLWMIWNRTLETVNMVYSRPSRGSGQARTSLLRLASSLSSSESPNTSLMVFRRWRRLLTVSPLMGPAQECWSNCTSVWIDTILWRSLVSIFHSRLVFGYMLLLWKLLSVVPVRQRCALFFTMWS